MIDSLGTRLKTNYEDRTRYYVPRRTFSILRIDQKCGHSYTRNLKKPFDQHYMDDLDSATAILLKEAQGACFAYNQSDEISILLTDFDKPTTNAWFDGNIQKICSVAASIFTANFNNLRRKRQITTALEDDIDLPESDMWPLGYFDSRIFTIPDWIEVYNYFVWRNRDCIRNSISSVASNYFSNKELYGKTGQDRINMLREMGVEFFDFSESQKYGRFIIREDGGWNSISGWEVTKDKSNKEKLMKMIPNYNTSNEES